MSQETLKEYIEECAKNQENIYEEYSICPDKELITFINSKIFKYSREFDLSRITNFKKENPNKKVIGVLYSGGFDSTYDILRELDKGNFVIPIINIHNSNNYHNTFQCLRYYCAYKVIEIISKHYDTLFDLVLNFENGFYSRFSFNYSQQMINAISLSMLGYTFIKEIDEFHMCIILGDDGVSYIKDMERIYKDTFKFQAPYYQESDRLLYGYVSHFDHNKIKIPPLKFPLIKYPKFYIIKYVVTNFKKMNIDNIFHQIKLLPIFSCENLKIEYNKDKIVIKNCKDCISCDKIKTMPEIRLTVILNINRYENGHIKEITMDTNYNNV